MDTLDHLNEATEIIQQLQIAAARGNVKINNPSGRCWYCGEKTDSKRRWCDADCLDLWEKSNG